MKTRTISVCMLIVALSFALSGCSGGFSYLDPDYGPGRLFPTSVAIEKDSIKVYKPVAGVKKAGFVYFKVHDYLDDDDFHAFMKQYLETIGFEKIYGIKELTRVVIEKRLSDKIKNLNDMPSLQELARATGPFIIIEARLYRGTSLNRRNLTERYNNRFKFDIKITDALSGETLLEASRDRIALRDFNREVMHPMMNLINDWYVESAKLSDQKP